MSNFSFDWDGTVTKAPGEFLAFAKALRAAGHKVYIVTMRYPSELGDLEYWRRHVDGIIATSRMAKKPAAKAAGIYIDIWIDDNPGAIEKSAMELWGNQSPEGTVDPHPISESESVQ